MKKLTSIHKLVAGLVVAGTLTVGGASVAHAAEPPTRTPPTTEQRCDRAKELWQHLGTFDDRLHEHYQQLVDLRARAEAAGRTEAVARIDARLAKMKERDAQLHTKAQQIRERVGAQCELPILSTKPL